MLWGGGHSWRGGLKNTGFAWRRLGRGPLSQHLPNVRLVRCAGPGLERKRVPKGRATGQEEIRESLVHGTAGGTHPAGQSAPESVVTDEGRKGSCPTDSLPTNRASTAEPGTEGLSS